MQVEQSMFCRLASPQTRPSTASGEEINPAQERLVRPLDLLHLTCNVRLLNGAPTKCTSLYSVDFIFVGEDDCA
jgi:hypothetical protein